MEQGEELMHSNYEFMKFVGFWCMPYPSLRIKGKWQHRSMPWILIGEFFASTTRSQEKISSLILVG
jgi:hypothetical protein